MFVEVNLAVVELTVVGVKDASAVQFAVFEFHITNDSKPLHRTAMVFALALGAEEFFGVVGLVEYGGDSAVVQSVVGAADSDYRPLFASGIINGNPLAENGRLGRKAGTKKCGCKGKEKSFCHSRCIFVAQKY